MAALLLDIVTYFTSKQLIVGDGVDAFRDFKPETPDNIISVHEYAINSLINDIESIIRVQSTNDLYCL